MMTKTPSPDHEQFDSLCADLEDWETLPVLTAGPTEDDATEPEEEHVEPIDGLILAGLVLPY
jgi:hypothetical protein